MDPPVTSSGKPSGRAGPFLFFVILGIIIACLAAFIILRPNPS